MLFADPDLHPEDEVLAAYRQASGRVKERYHIVLLSLQGQPCPAISKLVRRSPEAVRGWLNRYNAEGLEGLADREHPGRPGRLTDEERGALKDAVAKGPQANGLNFATWDCKSLSWWLHRKYGKQVSQERVRTLLHELGCAVVRPRHKLRKASEEEKKGFWVGWPRRSSR